MIVTKRKPELMAPAGDFTMLRTVVQNGADAVYLGIENLNMRVKAANFTIENLGEIVEYCSEHKVAVYITLNTILKPGEIQKAEEIVIASKRSGVAMVICWDPAVIMLCKQHEMPFCISTQASVANVQSALFYQTLGAKRIVPARECSLEEIREIKQNTQLEIETFVHGAMCIAVSGRCFMSHEIFKKSGNQGECLQPCRREYKITDKDSGFEMVLGEDYVLSAKDMNTLPILDRLIDAGIDSFKIEGRKRSPEYAGKVTKIYREAIDSIFDGTWNEEVISKLNDELSLVYNRGYSDGFYLGDPDENDFATSGGNESPVKKKYVGKVLDYYKKAQVAFITCEANEIKTGDTIVIMGPTSGVIEHVLTGIRVNDIDGDEAPKGSKVTFPFPILVRPNDKVYKLSIS